MKPIEFPKWIYFKDGKKKLIQGKEELVLCDKDMLCELPQTFEQIKAFKAQKEKESYFPLSHEKKKSKKAKEK